jgi:hypothetical protein
MNTFDRANEVLYFEPFLVVLSFLVHQQSSKIFISCYSVFPNFYIHLLTIYLPSILKKSEKIREVPS